MTLTNVLVILLILQAVLLILRGWQIRTLKKLHQHDLATTRKTWLEFGRAEVRVSLPIIQHCNSRTDYEFIKHRYDPEKCKHCREVQDVLNER